MEEPVSRLTAPGGLANRLHAIRQAAGLTGVELAGQLDWVRSKISKLETGRQMPTREDLLAWCRACGVDDAVRDDMLDQLAGLNAEHRQWRHRLRHGQGELQVGVDELVQRASLIRNFETLIIPGLAQTAAYARNRIELNVGAFGFNTAEVDNAVAARMRRQDVLHDTSKSFQLVILDLALRSDLVPAEVMLGQIDRLLALVGAPNILLAIAEAQHLTVPPLAGFLLLDSDLAVVETYASSVRVQGEEAAAYERIMQMLLESAATGDQARRLILSAAEKTRRER